MQIGDTVHLGGQKAEYSRFGKDGFSSCILPEGTYVVIGIDDDYINLAWREVDGSVSRKHRYRIERSAMEEA